MNAVNGGHDNGGTSSNGNGQRLRLVIVGGVAGGASAAARARRANEHASIVMFEKDAHVSFANCGMPYYIGQEIKDRQSLLVTKPEVLRRRFDLDVRTRTVVTKIDRQRKQVTAVELESGREYVEAYDKLILAPGASPVVPPLPGVKAGNVFTMRSLEDADGIKRFVDERKPGRAVVVGAGHIGMEMVEQLVGRGIGVTVVELAKQVLPVLDGEMAQVVAEELVRLGVDVRVGVGIAGFATSGDGSVAVAAMLGDGSRVEAEMFVMGVGVRPNVQLAVDAGLALGPGGGIATDEVMRTSDGDIYAVGDVAEYVHGVTGRSGRVPLAGPANRSGRIAGQHAVTGHAPAMAGVMGTSIVRVFEQTAGATGLTMTAAKRLGVDAKAVYVVGKDHAGYYPGAEQLTLKLVYEAGTGRVLGAQAVGANGVDKRIDVIATAMAFGATVEQLAGVDLAYAPQFGSAKDPVHIAAFAAANEIAGFVDFVSPEASLTGHQIVDVRSAQEVTEYPHPCAPGARHIPLDELRDRIGELDPALSTIVLCGTGLRAHVAVRILKQHGFNHVKNLSGGYVLRNRARLAGLIPDCQAQTSSQETHHASHHTR